MRTLRAKVGAFTAGLVIAGTVWLSVQAKAQDQNIASFLAFGMVGLAAGQSAHLNVVTVGVPSDMAVELTFFDKRGAILLRDVQKLSPGQAGSIIIHYVPGVDGAHYPVRGLVRFNKPNRGYVLPTLEVVDDSSGRSTVLEPNPEG